MRLQTTPRTSSRHRHVLAVPLAAAALALGISACGGDEEVGTLPPPELGVWQARVNGFCSDGSQEAAATLPPESSEEIPLDSQTRSEIVVTVRDAILPLARPEGTEPDVEAYLAELTDDAKQLQKIASAAAVGDDYLVYGELDESAGEVAGRLGLEECVAFSNAIARTP